MYLSTEEYVVLILLRHSEPPKVETESFFEFTNSRSLCWTFKTEKNFPLLLYTFFFKILACIKHVIFLCCVEIFTFFSYFPSLFCIWTRIVKGESSFIIPKVWSGQCRHFQWSTQVEGSSYCHYCCTFFWWPTLARGNKGRREELWCVCPVCEHILLSAKYVRVGSSKGVEHKAHLTYTGRAAFGSTAVTSDLLKCQLEKDHSPCFKMFLYAPLSKKLGGLYENKLLLLICQVGNLSELWFRADPNKMFLTAMTALH